MPKLNQCVVCKEKIKMKDNYVLVTPGYYHSNCYSKKHMSKEELIKEIEKAIQYQTRAKKRDDNPIDKSYSTGKLVAYTECLSLARNLK